MNAEESNNSEDVQLNEDDLVEENVFFKSLKPILTDTEEEVMSDADKIWEEIKGIKINAFSLPNQEIQNHAVKVKSGSDELYLKLSSTAVIVSLEEALASKFTVEQADDFVVVKRL
jgi:hypothetical protein